MLSKQGKTAKKQHLEKKEYAMQLLVSFDFSGYEFRMYFYKFTLLQITKHTAAK